LEVTPLVAAPSVTVPPEIVSFDAPVSEPMLRTSGSARREFPFSAAAPTPVLSRGGETSTGMMGVATLPGERMTSFDGEASLAVCAVAMLAAPSAQASRLSLIVDFIVTPLRTVRSAYCGKFFPKWRHLFTAGRLPQNRSFDIASEG
jgi:energy-converting hydrogenase Eha subunit A